MVAILDKACQKRITEVKVEWQQHSNNLPAPIQAPACVTSVFSGSRLVVYGYVENCTQAKLTACVNNMTFETVVSTSELNITKGKMLHQLTARAVIKDYEEGISETDPIQQQIFKEERKQMIIELSKEYCIVTPYTSFVAIEERHDDEEKMEGESVDKLVAEEDVDILPYMGWTVPDNWQDMNVEEEVRSLLQQGEIAEGFSQHEAERCYIMALQHAEDIQDNASLQDMVKKTAKNFFEKSDSEKSQQMLKIVHRIAPEKKEIKVKFLSGKMITPELNATDTVADLKARIFDLEGIPLKIQRLIAESKLLNDADSIPDLENEETVHLVLNLRGGEEHQQLPKLSTQSFYQKRRKRAIMYRSMEDSPSVDERSSLYSDPVHLISEASHRTGTKEQEHENEDGERVGKKKMKRKKRSYISLTNKTSMSTNGLKPNEDQSSIFPSSSIREECQTGGNFNTPQLLGSQPTSIALQPLPISDEMIDSYMEDFSADAGLMDKLITDLLPEEDDLLDDAVEESDCKVSTPVFSSNKLKPTSQRRPFTSKRSVKRGRRIGFVEVGLKGSSPDSEDDDLQVGCPSDSEKKSTSPKKPIASKRIATKAARREFVEDGLKGSSCSSDTEDDDREISCPSDSEKKTTSQKRPIASKQIPTKAARKEFVEDEVKGSSCSSDSEDEHSEIGCPSDSKDSDEVSSSHSSVLPSIDMTSLHRSMPSGFSLASASHQLSPQYSNTLPSYTHRSPVYQSTTPAYCPISPAYCPTSTTYQPPLPAYCPPPPTDHPALPPYPSASAYRPVWPAYSPASPSYSPLSPSYSPVDLRVAPAFCQKSSPNNQTAYLPTASLPTSNKQEQPRQPFSGMSENQSKQMLESKTGSWSRNSSTAYERTSAGFPLFDRAKIEKPDHENQFQSKFEQYIPNPADSIYMPTLASSVTTSTAAHKTPRGTKGVRKERKISSPEVIARCRSQKSSEGSKSMSISSDRDSIPVRKSGKELKGKLKSVERRSGRQRSRSRSKGSRSMSLCSDSSEGKQEKLREGSRFERNSKCRQKSKSRSRNERVRSKSRSRERRLRSERRSRDRGPRSESRNRDERLKLRGRRRECGQSSKSDSRGLTQRSKSRERERRRRSISSSSDPRQRSRSYEYKGILSRRETDTTSRKGRDINSRSRRRSREPYPRPRSSQRELDSRSRSRSRDYYAMSRSRSRDCYTRSRSRRRDSYSGHRRKDFYSRSRSRDFDPRSRDRHYDSYLRRKMRDLFTLFRRARNRNRYLCTRSRRRRRDFYSRSRSRSRDFYTKSRSWSRDFYTKSRSRSRDFYTRSRSRSRDFYTRSRSRSRDLYTRSRSRNRDLYTRSRSRSRDFYTRSRSTSRDLCTRSRSRSRTFYTRSRSRSKQGPKSRVNTKLNCTVPDLWNGIILHHSRVSIDKLPTPVEDQYWELTQDSMSKIGVCADKVRQILNQHGIRSLGKSTEELICRITATLLIAVHQFMCNIRKNNLSVDDSFLISSSIRDFQSTDSNRITIQLSNFEKVEFDFPKKSFDWLKSMISQWSYLIDHLEMGRGLRDFLISVYTQFKRN